MQTAATATSELIEGWLDSDRDTIQWRVNFPINKYTGAEHTAVVYFELEPGKRLGRHTDSAEEILYIVSGTAEAEVGGERGILKAGDLAVVPAMVPHAVANAGDETVRVVGFFCESEIVSTFEEEIQPMGVAKVEMGAPIPA